jgi:hypothetical protein
MKPPTTFCAAVTFAVLAIAAIARVTTSQYDNLRTGATLHEKILISRNINGNQNQGGIEALKKLRDQK